MVDLTAEEIRKIDIAVRRYDPNVGDVYCSLCSVSQQGKPTHADDCIMQRLWAATLAGELAKR